MKPEEEAELTPQDPSVVANFATGIDGWDGAPGWDYSHGKDIAEGNDKTESAVAEWERLLRA